MESYFSDDYVKKLPNIIAILYRRFRVNEWNDNILEPYNYNSNDRLDWFLDFPITHVYGILPEYMKFRESIIDQYQNLMDETEQDDYEETEQLDAEERKAIDDEKRQKKWAWEQLIWSLCQEDLTKFKAQQGGFTGYLWRQTTDAMGNIVSGWYEFAVDRKFDDKGVSLRSFCTNNNAAFVAVEETYGDVSYNGHAKKDPKYLNGMTNFGILMEIKGIDNPFEWCREAVKKVQIDGTGTYYSPSRKPSLTSEGTDVSSIQVEDLMYLYDSLGKYAQYIVDFIEDMKKVFPTLKDDWGIYMPEVKYLSPEPLVNYEDLSLTKYPNVHFVGDALSARGITVSGAHGVYVAESFLK